MKGVMIWGIFGIMAIAIISGIGISIMTQAQPSPNYNFTHTDGLTFMTRDNGIITIKDNGEVLGKYGLVFTGKVNGTPRIFTVENFTWTWSKSNYTYIQEEWNETLDDFQNISYNVNVYTGNNNYPAFTVIQIFEANPLTTVKWSINVTNNLGVDITDVKVWFVNTIDESMKIKFNNNKYSFNRSLPIHLSGNFDDIIPRLGFGKYQFEYADLIGSGFNITDIYIGDGNIIGHPGIAMVGLGVTKGNRVFPDGYTLVLDPVVTAWLSPAQTCCSNWTNPDNVKTSDNTRATETTIGHTMVANDWDVDGEGIPIGSTILGIEISIEGHGGACPIPPDPRGDIARIGVSLSNDSGSSYSAEQTRNFACSAADLFRTYGSSSDTWGIVWTIDALEGVSTLAKLNYASKAGNPSGPEVDHVRLRVHYDPPMADIIYELPTPADDSIISAMATFNASNTILSFAECQLEENSTGTFINNTMGIDGKFCNLTKRGFPNATTFDFRIFGDLGSGWNATPIRTATVFNRAPTLTINSPPNHSATGNTYMVINVSVEDPDDDQMDIILNGANDTDDLSQAIVFKIGNTENGTYLMNFSSRLTEYPQSDSIFAWYHLDELDIFGENSTHAFDFSGNGFNGTITNATISAFGNRSGYEFDATVSPRIQIGNGSDFNDVCDSGCTFSAWIYESDVSEPHTIFGKRDDDSTENYFTFVMQSDRPTISLYEGPGATPVSTLQSDPLEDETWYLLTYTYNTTTVKIYVNGAINKTQGTSTVPDWDASVEPMFIGAQNAGGIEEEWDGYIAEAVIWEGIVLEADEVLDLYRLGIDTYYYNVTVTDLTNSTQQGGLDFGVIYDTGNLEADCTEDWTLVDDLNLGGNDGIFTGQGTFTMNANIFNWNRAIVHTPCRIVTIPPHRLLS